MHGLEEDAKSGVSPDTVWGCGCTHLGVLLGGGGGYVMSNADCLVWLTTSLNY